MSAARSVLERSLDRAALFALSFGAMIGVGWVTAMGTWLGAAGPVGASLAFALGGLAMLAIGLCYAEATAMLPVSGGEIAYAYGAAGVRSAFAVGWFLAFGYAAVCAFEAVSVGAVLGEIAPALSGPELYRVGGHAVRAGDLALGAIATAALTALHCAGVRWASRLQKALVACFGAASAIFVAAAFAGGSLANLAPPFAEPGAGGALRGVAAVLVTVPFWYVGFDVVPQSAEEADASLPARSLGTAIVGSIAAAAAFYVVVILAVSAIEPWRRSAGLALPSARAFEVAFGSTALARLVLVAALLGLITSWNSFFLAASRVVFALGRGALISTRFGATHPRLGTPHRAVLLVGAATLVASALGREALVALVNVGSFCIAFAFLGVASSVLALRRRFPDLPRPYRAPGGAWVPRAAQATSLAILAAMLAPGSPVALRWPLEAALLGLVLVSGAAFWAAARREREAVDEVQRAYLILEDRGAVAAATAPGGAPWHSTS